MPNKEHQPQTMETHNGETAPKTKRVFVEIGTHNLPASWMGSKKFGDNEIYVGIEINPGLVKEAKEITEEDRRQKNVHFINADAGRLPLMEKSADEVFLGNVLGDPGISEGEKDKFIEEAKRLLRDNGVIVIKETNTPASLEYLRRLLAAHNLKVIRGVTSDSPKWSETVKPYDKISAKRPWTDSYAVFVQPVKEEHNDR